MKNTTLTKKTGMIIKYVQDLEHVKDLEVIIYNTFLSLSRINKYKCEMPKDLLQQIIAAKEKDSQNRKSGFWISILSLASCIGSMAFAIKLCGLGYYPIHPTNKERMGFFSACLGGGFAVSLLFGISKMLNNTMFYIVIDRKNNKIKLDKFSTMNNATYYFKRDSNSANLELDKQKESI